MKCRCVRMDGTGDLRKAVPVWVLTRMSSGDAVETAMVDALEALFEKAAIWLPGL